MNRSERRELDRPGAGAVACGRPTRQRGVIGLAGSYPALAPRARRLARTALAVAVVCGLNWARIVVAALGVPVVVFEVSHLVAYLGLGLSLRDGGDPLARTDPASDPTARRDPAVPGSAILLPRPPSMT